MAATRYQLLYRYINEATNVPITNNLANEYEKAEEFYSVDHLIKVGDENQKIACENDKEQLISFGNSTDNPKNDMVFAYDGTKKVRHKKWVKEQTGCYVLRDWKSVDRNLIGNAGDYSKDFVTLNGESPELGGTVVCKTAAISQKYFPNNKVITVVQDNSLADQGSGDTAYYSESKISSLIKNATPFELEKSDYKDYMSPSQTSSVASSWYRDSWGTWCVARTPIYIGPIAVNQGKTWIEYPNTREGGMFPGAYGALNKDDLYNKCEIKYTHLKTMTVPGHYEEVTSYPYVIKDTYKRIQMTPWFVHGTYGSLEAALEKAKTLIEMIGLENVKLIKLVPFDQFVKIQ